MWWAPVGFALAGIVALLAGAHLWVGGKIEIGTLKALLVAAFALFLAGSAIGMWQDRRRKS